MCRLAFLCAKIKITLWTEFKIRCPRYSTHTSTLALLVDRRLGKCLSLFPSLCLWQQCLFSSWSLLPQTSCRPAASTGNFCFLLFLASLLLQSGLCCILTITAGIHGALWWHLFALAKVAGVIYYWSIIRKWEELFWFTVILLAWRTEQEEKYYCRVRFIHSIFPVVCAYFLLLYYLSITLFILQTGS